MYGESPDSNNEYLDNQNNYENQEYDEEYQKDEDEQIDSIPFKDHPLGNIPQIDKTEVITTKDDEI